MYSRNKLFDFSSSSTHTSLKNFSKSNNSHESHRIEENLLQIFQNSTKARTSAFGIVIDSTATYKIQRCQDHITQMKIIDSSLNCEEQNLQLAKKFVHVFFYTKSNEKPPIIMNIGDIVLLNRFMFEMNDQYKEYKAKQLMESEFFVFNCGKNNENDSTDFEITFTNSNHYFFDKFQEQIVEIKKKIIQLRKWSINFFSQTTCSPLQNYIKLLYSKANGIIF